MRPKAIGEQGLDRDSTHRGSQYLRTFLCPHWEARMDPPAEAWIPTTRALEPRGKVCGTENLPRSRHLKPRRSLRPNEGIEASLDELVWTPSLKYSVHHKHIGSAQCHADAGPHGTSQGCASEGRNEEPDHLQRHV